jgi:serpin B
VDALALDYRSKVSLVDFDDKAGARDTINAEVSRQTEGTIEELLGPEDIMDDTTMVLTNAVYFKAGWATPFVAESTTPAPFHNLDGSESEVDMMDAIDFHDYAETDTVQALRLPYEGGETAMLLLLPKGDLASFEAGLDVNALDALRSQLARSDVHVRLPSFSLRSALKMKETLTALGMYAGFIGQAHDFSGIGPFQQYITEVVHQAFIATDEAGTEAGAATAVIFGEESAGPSGSITFTADKPFILLLEDVPTGSVLFAGRYVQAE